MRRNCSDYIDMIIVTDHDPKIMHALGNVVDLGLRNYCNSIGYKYIAQGFSIKRRFLLSYMYIPFAVPEPLVKSLLRKISSEIAGFRVVKPREKSDPIPPNYFFAHRFQTSMLLVPLDSTKSYRYATARQTRWFKTVDLI